MNLLHEIKEEALNCRLEIDIALSGGLDSRTEIGIASTVFDKSPYFYYRTRFMVPSFIVQCTSFVSDFPISHASQLANLFLGLPLESDKCESCGAAEPDNCEGHFGYIELPNPIYHASHVSILKRLLSLLCLKCLKMKNVKLQIKNVGILEKTLSSCCETIGYMAERVVGLGSFGLVFQAKCLEIGETVAIKKVLQNKRYRNMELQTMRLLYHPKVYTS